jgi:uncharacterized protein YjbI with pentapeptide repeats
MADAEHLAILRRGVHEWNAWRTQCEDRPFLHSANLSDFQLQGVNFSEADLRSARFDHANLSWGDFRGSNLNSAKLNGAHLSGANFSGTTIGDYANFTGAHLDRADLSGASFVSADFQEAFFYNAKLHKARLTRANFRNAKAAPPLKRGDIVSRARSHFGAAVSDLDDDEVNEMRRLCAAFMVASPDRAEMESLRTTALLQAKLPSIDIKNLAKIFRANSEGDSCDLDLIAQLMYDIDCTKGADFSGSDLTEANLSGASLTKADFRGANLSKAVLVGTNLKEADLTGASVYGIAAWDVNLEGAVQRDLHIAPPSFGGQGPLSVDQIELAQFLYLLLNNDAIRRVIDTITSKVVLILGRFTPERKVLLEGIKTELRARCYVPVLFDFEKPNSQTLTETVETLAHLARFIIADLTDAKSVLQELRGVVPDCPSVPVLPLLLSSQSEPGMLDFFNRYPWFLSTVRYDSPEALLTDLAARVIAPAELKWTQLKSTGS